MKNVFHLVEKYKKYIQSRGREDKNRNPKAITEKEMNLYRHIDTHMHMHAHTSIG